MAPRDLETMAMRAVELTVLGRDDPRLLVATKRRLSRPKKVARLLAGLCNAAEGRQTILLIGIRRGEVPGLHRAPDHTWWESIHRCFPGTEPALNWSIVDIDGAEILAIAPTADAPVPVERGGRVLVPYFDRGEIVTEPPTLPDRHSPADTIPTATVLGGWVERSILGNDDIDAFRGQLEIELSGVTGVLPDKNSSATLLIPSRERPIELDVQIHPSADDVGVFRLEDGIEVYSTFRVRLFIAAAVPADDRRENPASVQLVISLLLPGRAVPELRSLLLSPDPTRQSRWLL